MKNTFEDLITRSPKIIEAYDVSSKQFHVFENEVEDWYHHQEQSYQELDNAARNMNNSVSFRTALKIVRSREIIRNINEPVTITLLNPVYKETGRMQPRELHPHGEDSIRYKIGCLNQLESINSLFKARFVVIDDECPNGSGKMAESIISQEYPKEFESGKYRVLYLGEGIDSNDPNIPLGITHKSGSNRSVKGGALLYGMKSVIDDSMEGLHIIIDNDADLSITPLQIGLLIEDILHGTASAVAGSRREEESVSIIGESRNSRGQFFIMIWSYFLPDLARRITDTNRAFKAFEAKSLKTFLDDIRIYTFPYQIELLQACISHGFALEKRGISYIDSEAASTQSGANITETYLNQIHQIIDISLRYDAVNANDPYVQFFTSIDEEQWAAVEANPPSTLESLLNNA